MIQHLRRNYDHGSLSRSELHADPIEQFRRWFQELLEAEVPEWFEVNAVVLATADRSGRVSSRVVLLKGVDPESFRFYTNYRSHKARDLEDNANAAMTFYWPMFARQVRVEGTVTKTDDKTSDEYFYSRPLLSQFGAAVSPQSEVIPDDLDLDKEVEALRQRVGDQVPRPEFWGGYSLSPVTIEFWQGRSNRLHDRYRYRRTADSWIIERLAP